MTGRRAAGEPEVQRPAHGISIGVDLAAASVNTAAVELGWEGDRATIVDVWGEGRECVSDAVLVSLLDRSDAEIGVGCPFGWPQEFVELVGDQGGGEPGGSGCGKRPTRRRTSASAWSIGRRISTSSR